MDMKFESKDNEVRGPMELCPVRMLKLTAEWESRGQLANPSLPANGR